MAKSNYEIRAINLSLSGYLSHAGYVGLTIRENFNSQDAIIVPSIGIHFLPSTKKGVQLGGEGAERFYNRVVQIDTYMESKNRADAITDDIMDFFDSAAITINDPSNNPIGSLICPSSENIYGDVLAPILTDPKLIRWRGVVRAPLEVHYSAP